ncbi:type I restriction enzyme, S subunit [Chitinophaga sp. YR573]|uniref:restriction endonuclease subunit S n=1 Tax=Chitinophaga sp. YR573 TaxID=1881040 RepID=UPI0008D571CE|nr:restriction endonuclease subunit S [Chitinophaga sp. YR573]SEW46006.1 type I restriction enzyme, S subunit [Chitinophaga sp. YR573]
MQSAVSTYLKFIELIQLDNWSVQTLLDSKVDYSNRFEFAKIGEFLIKKRQIVNIEDGKFYKRVTVKINNNGVVLRDIEQGINIGTKKQYLANSGQFIISKIDARNGAFGIIPNDLDGAIVTNDFPLFEVNEKRINPQFLLLITTTKEFIKFAQSCSSGTTNRQRMDIDLFLNQKIPLPSISEQNKIVNDYNKNVREASELQQQAIKLESEIENYFFEQLGLEKEEEGILKKGIQLVQFEYLEKWGLDFIKGNVALNESNFRKYSVSDLCKISSGGTPSRSRKEYFENGNIPWIKTGELNNNIIYDTEEKITSDALKFSSAKLYDVGSIAIAMYGATIGKTAKLGVKAATNQACAVLFDINNEIVLTDYLWEFLQTQTNNLKKMAYGSAQPNLNAGIISDYKVVVPSLTLQTEIVKTITNYKNQIKALKFKSVNFIDRAIHDFEKAIFS